MIRASRGLFRSAAALLLWAALGSQQAVAHDFWIAPSSFDPEIGAELYLRLLVGEPFRGRPLPRDANLFARFSIVDRAGERQISGSDGDEPAGKTVVQQPGWQVVVLRTKPAFTELDAERFETYLREHRQDHVIRARASRGESARPVLEAFSRCAKALVRSGDGADHLLRKAFGLDLELVPESATMELGLLTVSLILNGSALRDAWVVATNEATDSTPIGVVTDSRGRATIEIDRPGRWLLTSLRVRPAAPGSGADWESLWASLSFRVPAARDR